MDKKIDRYGVVMNRILLVLCTVLLSGMILAQGRGTLSGFVYDKSSGEALIGVNVYVQELEIGSSSNVSGYYIIPQLPSGNFTLVCEYLGYRSVRIPVSLEAGDRKVLDVFMPVELIQGETVEVVADSVRTSRKLYDKAISNIQLSAREINTIPQVAEADLLRSLQTLPGILPVSDYSSALYVRGGTPDQNLYMLDGTDVYNPEHAFGLFSTFNTDAIKHVEISKGGFGAAYGGRLSSVLDVINLDGNREVFEGSAAISLLSAKTTLQMPLGDRGAISGSIRRTYFDQTVAKAIDEVPDYYFYDGNLKAFWEMDPNNKITVSFYGGRDRLDLVFNPDSEDEAGFLYDWGNRTGSLRWTRVFNPQLFANFWVTGSRFSSNFDFGETAPLTERNFVSDVTLKGNMEYHYSRQWLLKFGFEQKFLRTLFRQNFPGGQVDVEDRPRHSIAYLQGNWRPTARWDIEGGLRYNYISSGKEFQDLEPRLSAKYRLTETINLKLAAGRYNQYLHRIPRTFVSDIWSTSNEYQNQSRADHLILGFQQEVLRDYSLEVETFLKDYHNIYQFNQTFLTDLEPGRRNDRDEPVYDNTKGLFNKGDGRSYGLEVLFRKEAGPLTGWIGYSYSDTEYEFPQVNEGEAFSPRHDRRSTVNLVSNIDVKNFLRAWRGQKQKQDGGSWTMGVNFVYSSGQPITMPGSGYFFGEAPGALSRDINYFPAEINNYRLPYYARLDLSVSYKKRFKNWSMQPYLQVYNIGNRQNVWFVDYNFTDGVSDIETINMFPILPTLGINFTF